MVSRVLSNRLKLFRHLISERGICPLNGLDSTGCLRRVMCSLANVPSCNQECYCYVREWRSTRMCHDQYTRIRRFASKASRQDRDRRKQQLLDRDESEDDSAQLHVHEDNLDRDWDPEIDGKHEIQEDEEPKDWKDIQQHVPSLRLDAVLSAGLGVSRKKIEEAYLSMRLRVNGEKVTKKSRQVKEGDILDIILEHKVDSEAKKSGDGEGMSVMRLYIQEISSERTGKDRVPVMLRRWKQLRITKPKK